LACESCSRGDHRVELALALNVCCPHIAIKAKAATIGSKVQCS
jgi:hypothetical protein